MKKFFILLAAMFLIGCGSDYTAEQQELLDTYGLSTPVTFMSNSNKDESIVNRHKKTEQSKNTNETADKFAFKYYNAWMKGKDEVHYIVNFHLKTVSAIAKAGDDIAVNIYEWNKGNEHYIETILNGNHLNEYLINPTSGEVTKTK